MTRFLRGFSCLLPLVLTGCVAPLAFTEPCSPGPTNNSSCQPTAPVTQAQISFAPDFVGPPSNSLTVTFNNQDVTSLLVPGPTPNGTSTLMLPFPNYYSPTQTLTASLTCGFFCAYPIKTMTFTPPSLSIGSVEPGGPFGPLEVHLGTPLSTFVTVSPPLTTAAQVTLIAAPYNVVGLATTPNGTPSPNLTVALSSEAQVYLVPLAPGPFTVFLTGAGVQQGQVMGNVQ